MAVNKPGGYVVIFLWNTTLVAFLENLYTLQAVIMKEVSKE